MHNNLVTSWDPDSLRYYGIASDILSFWEANPVPQAPEGFYSSEWCMVAWETFGGRWSASACTAAFLGQLSGICMLEMSNELPQCSLSILWNYHRLSCDLRTESALNL